MPENDDDQFLYYDGYEDHDDEMLYAEPVQKTPLAWLVTGVKGYVRDEMGLIDVLILSVCALGIYAATMLWMGW